MLFSFSLGEFVPPGDNNKKSKFLIFKKELKFWLILENFANNSKPQIEKETPKHNRFSFRPLLNLKPFLAFTCNKFC